MCLYFFCVVLDVFFSDTLLDVFSEFSDFGYVIFKFLNSCCVIFVWFVHVLTFSIANVCVFGPLAWHTNGKASLYFSHLVLVLSPNFPKLPNSFWREGKVLEVFGMHDNL